jgi:phage shock protein A
MGSQKVAAKELADAQAVSADWNDKAKVALRAGKEDLAKKALDAKVGVDEQVTQLQASYDQITAQVDKLRDQVQTLKIKLDEARARQNVLIARAKMAEAQQNVATSINTASFDSAFAKLDAMERKITEKEAVAEAFTEIGGADVDINDQFETLQHEAAVNDQLAALKAELGL